MAYPKTVTDWPTVWQDFVDELEDTLDILYIGYLPDNRSNLNTAQRVIEAASKLREYLKALEADEGV